MNILMWVITISIVQVWVTMAVFVNYPEAYGNIMRKFDETRFTMQCD